MEQMKRFAIYYAPQAGAFADAAAAWLGWDLAKGCAVVQPVHLPDLPAHTQAPRKYGFHGTIKPPFRLAAGVSAQDLARAVQSLAACLPVAAMQGVQFAQIGGFLALIPRGDTTALAGVAAEVVRGLDPYRAPLTPAEVARRRPDSLTQRQQALLAIYGYPYVMEEFQFHLTLSGQLDGHSLNAVQAAAEAHFDGLLPQPFVLADLCLCGEDEAGRFHLLHRYALMA
jgi:putative phosphonate metabolism protein